MQRKQIQEALNKQTLEQFTNYARQLHPDSPEEQLKLIKHLQEQHYVQYMQQIYEQQEQSSNHISQNGSLGDVPTLNNSVSEEEAGESSDIEGATETPSNSQIVPASIWTRKDIKEFKATINKESPESIIKVGHGETVTVLCNFLERIQCMIIGNR
uniref:Uncharacterized protein n=1 Tax=Romanomermis culicivorax TaxID=13658 RepID=A0A915K2X9_ROMCU